MENMTCAKCQKTAKGWKCDKCGAEAVAHDEGHGCGGAHCVPKCEGCSEAESKCSC